MRKGNSEKLPPELAAELKALEALPEAEIDTGKMPEARDWSGAVRGRFFRPVKRQKTLRIDADVLDFFERQGPGYQTRMNAVLRAWMEAHGDAAPATKPGQGARPSRRSRLTG
ncbi:MAG TPA: BrnA antitoxin family protein [Acetobacteraceae bacterium]|nr:BrnA antitoxin family protein [Acetobacteraceae bacterium]